MNNKGSLHRRRKIALKEALKDFAIDGLGTIGVLVFMFFIIYLILM
ncbi:hypothetical protein J2S19_003243 [Metabacillus malikii]|uniref:Uncharacterized protein n=1 Tax=Metabacillus malikii TaxID=1504265 RepID=A0ABT9ZI48_9BACI|nr:hypothetical protein [Metabacillus malikii]